MFYYGDLVCLRGFCFFLFILVIYVGLSVYIFFSIGFFKVRRAFLRVLVGLR